MAGMEKQRMHMAAAHPPHGHSAHNGGNHGAHGVHDHGHAGHHLHPGHHLHTAPHAQIAHVEHGHRPKVKYRPAINILAFGQFIGGLLLLNFEAISAVLYRASASSLLHGVEYAGLYVSVFTMVTGIVGILTVRKSLGPRLRMCCFISDILLTIFLSIQTFSMCCASAAMLVFYTISWDSVLNLINRVTSTAQINLIVGTTTTTAASEPLPDVVREELQQDFNLLVGLRCILFALYFLLFISSVLSSCFSCCNYCKCWANRSPTAPSMADTHIATISPANPYDLRPTALVEKTEVVVKPGPGLVETHSEVVPVLGIEKHDKEKRGHKGHGHHKHKT